MDGLTNMGHLSGDGYGTGFSSAFVEAGCSPKKGDCWWHEKFLIHAQKVYDYMAAKERADAPVGVSVDSTQCPVDGSHKVCGTGKLTSGHQTGGCSCIDNRSSFLCFCMDKIEGYQSQRLMRTKLFLMLEDEARTVPKTSSVNAKDPVHLQKWLHSLQVVMEVFAQYCDPWLTFKFYGEDDLEWLFEDLLPRVSFALRKNKDSKLFDTKEGSEILLYILVLMQQIEDEYLQIGNYCETEARNTLFSKLIKQYSAVAEAGYKKSHDDTADLKKLSLVRADEPEDEDEE